MRKNIQKYTALLLIFALALSLAACGRDEAAESPAPEVAVEQTPAPVVTPSAAPVLETAFVPVSINEVMASNKSVLADEAGLFPDWVELYNYGSETLDLGGLFLCCGNDRWEIPSLSLEAGGYAVIFCSGSENAVSNMHADFAISKDGDRISLETASGQLIEQFNLPAMDSDESAYRRDDGTVIKSLMATPGFENSSQGYADYQASLACSSPLVINEVMVYNEWYLSQRGLYYDWAELKNVSSQPVELSEYFLSDSDSSRAEYRLPEYSLQPGESYIVYCTDETDIDFAAAPFGLGADNEQLYLSYQDGTLCDYVHLSNIPYGGSMGRLDGENGFFFFSVPSPGSSNNVSDSGRCFADKPVLLGTDGVYNGVDNVTVTLSGNGTVYYTLDGSLPDETSDIYSEPLTLSSTTVVRAVNMVDGQLPSDCLNLSYIINENHTLPVVSVVTDPENLFGSTGLYSNPKQDWESAGAVMFYENGQGFEIECGIKLHGETSKVAQDKKSFKLCFRSRYEGSLNYDLFENGVTNFASILLRAAQEDYYSSFMRDNIMHQLALEAFPELPAQDYKYSVLYLNGEYWGMYNIREAHSTTHYANTYGYDESTVTHTKERWPEAFDEVYRFAMNNNLKDEANYNYLAEHLNMDSVIGWTILQAYCANFDCNSPNMRFYYSTEDEQLRFALVDLDLGFFEYDMFDLPLSRYDYNYNLLAKRLLQSPIYQKEMARQLGAALSGPMSNENVIALIDRLEAELTPEVARDRELWGGSLEYWQGMVEDLREYVERKGGRAQLLVSSLMSRIDISNAEYNEFFGNVK